MKQSAEAPRPLLGRATEQHQLQQVLHAARGGVSRAVLMLGDPGVGKTALLDDAVASADGLRVVRVTGFESEADLAFAGLASLLRPFASGINTLPQPQAAALGAALGLRPPLSEGDRFTAYAAALTLLADAAERGPVLLVIDDAHWLDPATLDVIAFVSRRIAAEGIAIVMAAREEPATALDRSEGIATMRLAGLDDAAAAELVQRETGGCASDVALALARATGGNPLALFEAIAPLDADQLTGEVPLPDPLPVGTTLSRALADRLAPLPQPTRQALLIAATGSGNAPLVAEALGRAGLGEELSTAEAAGLVRLGESGVAFRHPLIRASVYELASDAERRAAHGLLADAARGRGDSDADALARHAAGAAEGPDEEAAAALESAAARAATRMGYGEAAEIMFRAARLTPDPGSQVVRLVEAGRLAMLAGRAENARNWLDRAIRDAVDEGLASKARATRAYLEMWTGRVTDAQRRMVAEIERIPPEVPERSMLLVDAAWASIMAGELQAGDALLRTAEEATTTTDPTIAVAPVVLLRLTIAAFTGEPDATDRLDAASELLAAMLAGDPSISSRASVLIGPMVWMGRHADAADLAERLIRTGRTLSAPSMLPFPLAGRTELRLAIGDWDGAYVSANEAIVLGDETGQYSVSDYARCHLARLMAARGMRDECDRLAREIREGVAAHESWSLVGYTHAARGLLELGAGNFAAARGELEQVHRLVQEHGVGSHRLVPYHLDLIEAAVRLDRRDVAEEALARLEGLDRAGYDATRGALERGRALLERDADQAIAHLQRAADLEEKAGLVFERARSQLLLGERLTRARRRRDARGPLEQALRTFASLGASPWVDRTVDALRALGARPRPPHSSPTTDLTPQELQVARAAAQGLSNREIASQLFLSVKTVEFHLRNAYAKVGVRSRTELALLLTPRAD